MANSNSNANVSTMCVHFKAKLSNRPAAIEYDDYQFNANLNSKHRLTWPNTDTSEPFKEKVWFAFHKGTILTFVQVHESPS